MPVQQTDILQIPLQLTRFVYHNKLVKPFSIFLFLKFYSSGKVHKDSETLKIAGQMVGIRDKRTFDKYFQQLLDLNWVGYNPKTGIYFVRSFDRIRLEHNFRKKQATTLWLYNLKKLQAFLVGSILSAEINGQQYYCEVVQKRKSRSAANKREAANPARISGHSTLPYYGLGLEAIEKLFGCKKTRASQLRAMAAKAGFIKVNHKFRELCVVKERDFNIAVYLRDIYPQYAGRIRFKKAMHKKQPCIKILLQLHDEIIPKVQFKSINKFNRLEVPSQIRQFVDRRLQATICQAA